MIDEKKLVEILSKNSIFEKITNAEGKNIFEIIEEQPKTDWIPCEVEMPKELGRYIVTLKDGRSLEAIYDNISKRFILYEHEVIAWQPLPAPYKKEGAENE